MIRFVTYDLATGRIKSQRSTVQPEIPEQYRRPGIGLLEINDELEIEGKSVVDGVIVDTVYTVEEQRTRVQREIRSRRAGLIAQSDWTQVPDVPFDAVRRKAWCEYRQALRDLPNTYQNETDPANIEWPKAPE